MPIKRKPKPPPKRRVKPNPAQIRLRLHRDLCDDLCNRLQAEGQFLKTAKGLATVANLSWPKDMPEFHMAVELMQRATTRLETLQLNHPDNVSFRCVMEYTDRTKEPELGYLFPVKAVVTTSPSMVLSVILAYVNLCKQIGRFI